MTAAPRSKAAKWASGFLGAAGQTPKRLGRLLSQVPSSRVLAGSVLVMVVGAGLVTGLVPASAQVAGLQLSAGVQYPPSVTVGATGVSATLTLINSTQGAPYNNDPQEVCNNPDDAPQATCTNQVLPGITVIPTCSVPNCTSNSFEPGILAYSATGTGVAGSACAGMTFNISLTDPATGEYEFDPVGGGPLILGPSNGSGASPTCVVAFTFSVLKAPTKDLNPNIPGLQTAGIAGAAIFDSANPAVGQGSGSTATMTINLATLQGISTSASPASLPVGSGGNISDSARLAASSPPGPTPGGSVTFTLYGPLSVTPTASSCTGAPASGPTAVTVTASTIAGPSFTPTVPGYYTWLASYSGDANYNPITTACGDPAETTQLLKAVPTIATTASKSQTLGGTVHDQAVLTGGDTPSGTITFAAYGPADATCSKAAAFTSSVSVSGDGTYPSGSFTTATAGTYEWVATYSGDGNNASVASGCGSTNEVSTIGLVAPSISTQASASVPLGGAVTDAAILSGGSNPGGTITFKIFGPNNPTCTGNPLSTTSVTVKGNGTYTSAPFTPTAPGTYTFSVAYGGDAANAVALSACGAAHETVAVGVSLPAITTQASAGITLGGSIADRATLSGGSSPTGTITVEVFGPNNATCSGTPVFTSTIAVNGNGTYTSAGFKPGQVGTYLFSDTYSGDTNNAPASSACGAPNESVSVAAVAALTATTLPFTGEPTYLFPLGLAALAMMVVGALLQLEPKRMFDGLGRRRGPGRHSL